MYAVTSMPPVRRTRATLRRAEFGFLGVVVYTRVHTPRFCGFPFSAGVLLLSAACLRPLRTSWLIVGNALLLRSSCTCHAVRVAAGTCLRAAALKSQRGTLPSGLWACQSNHAPGRI